MYVNYHMIVKSVNCHLQLSGNSGKLPRMARQPAEGTGAWNFREIPRELMAKVKMAAAYERKTVKLFLMDLARARISEMEKRGILPKR